MRTTLILLFIILINKTFAQLVVDPAVKQQYINAYNKLPLKQRQSNERLQNQLLDSYNKSSKKYKELVSYTPLNIGVITLHSIDTLNKSQLKANTYLYPAEKYTELFCEAALMSDSLGVVIYPGVAQNSGIDITHLIINNSVQTEYHQWIKYDTCFRTDLKEEKTNNLTLKFTTNKFVISDKNFTVGKTIYGYADITSKPYFQDETSFINGYIERRLHFRYYFKFVVVRNDTEY